VSVRAGGPLLIVAVILLGACGGGEPDGVAPSIAIDPSAGDKEAIVMLVQGWYDAIAEGESQTACSALTERGQRLMQRFAAEVSPEVGEHATSCATAVAGYWDSLMEHEQRQAIDSVEPVTTDDIYIEDGRTEAQVGCKYRGAIFVRRTDEGDPWRIDVPACVD
jgi:hypothetical protein